MKVTTSGPNSARNVAPVPVPLVAFWVKVLAVGLAVNAPPAENVTALTPIVIVRVAPVRPPPVTGSALRLLGLTV